MTEVFGIPLPESWPATRLKCTTSLLRRGSAPNYADHGKVRIIGQASNQDSGIDWSRTRLHEFSGDATKLKGYLEPGDVIINSTGTGTLGRVGFFTSPPEDMPCMADSHVTITRFLPDRILSRFAFYWMKSQPIQEYIYTVLAVGATNQIELNRDRLAGTPIPLPPLTEQRRIANFLDNATSKIDEIIAIRERQLATLEESIYSEISEILIPDIIIKPAGTPPFTWLPAPPSDIPMVRLAYICKLQNGITIDGKRDTSVDAITRPYLRVANVQAGHFKLDSVVEVTVPREIARRSTLRRGDVLMTEGGDLDKLGRGAVWCGEIPDCLHQNHIFALRPDRDRLNGDYLSLMTQTVHGRCYFESTGSKTTNLASTNSSKILGFPIPLPSMTRQQELTSEAHEHLRSTAHLREALQRQVDLLTERRQALITAAVTGQIDVSTASGRGIED